MENKQIEIEIDEPNNEKEISEMLDNCTRIMSYNISFKTKEDKYLFDKLPLTPEDKLEIINSILKENADYLKNKSI
jgi:F0F1-type ATP synthase delta subunit